MSKDKFRLEVFVKSKMSRCERVTVGGPDAGGRDRGKGSVNLGRPE